MQITPATQFSLYLIAALLTGFCSLLLFVSSRRRRGTDPLTWWAISMALSAGGLLATATRFGNSPAPPFVSSSLAIALLLLGGGASWMGARAFAERRVIPVIGLAGAAIWLIALNIPHFSGATSTAMALSWGISAIYAVAVVVALWPDGREELPSRSFLLLLIGLDAAIYLARAGMAAYGIETALQSSMAVATVVEAELRSVGVSFLVLALSKERAELSIARSRDLAREAGDARRRFLAQMSHEVRTPLNSVLGLAQVLLADERLETDQRTHVATLEAAGRHLLAIVNDALDLAKIDAGHLVFTIRPFNPADAVNACLDLVRPAAAEKHIRLQLRPAATLPTMISGDTTRLQQILLNLLWNAVKFTPSGGAVTLRVGAGSDWLRCEVIDTGPGIPPAKQVMLFQDFARLDPNAADGTGLGLAISARLVERMGGRLSYHPGPGGEGSLFRVQLPWPAVEDVRPAAEETLPEPEPIEPEFSQPLEEAPPEPVEPPQRPVQLRPDALHLLVVDDVRANRMMLRALLSADGHSVVEAGDGAEALELTMRDQFDAVLMDIRMPVMDGIEATRRIRKLPGEAGSTPVIAISADVMPETMRACLASGMSAVVAKPVERHALTATLRRLELHRYRTPEREVEPTGDI